MADSKWADSLARREHRSALREMRNRTRRYLAASLLVIVQVALVIWGGWAIWIAFTGGSGPVMSRIRLNGSLATGLLWALVVIPGVFAMAKPIVFLVLSPLVPPSPEPIEFPLPQQRNTSPRASDPPMPADEWLSTAPHETLALRIKARNPAYRQYLRRLPHDRGGALSVSEWEAEETMTYETYLDQLPPRNVSLCPVEWARDHALYGYGEMPNQPCPRRCADNGHYFWPDERRTGPDLLFRIAEAEEAGKAVAREHARSGPTRDLWVRRDDAVFAFEIGDRASVHDKMSRRDFDLG